MKFMMFIKHAEGHRMEDTPKSLFEAMEAFVAEGFKNGTLKDTAGLKPTAEAIRIRSKNGKLTTTDGPYAEAKEVVGGYAVVELKSKDEAREVARQFMEIHRVHFPEFECECEVRQIDEF
jgi:hypothetical protein